MNCMYRASSRIIILLYELCIIVLVIFKRFNNYWSKVITTCFDLHKFIKRYPLCSVDNIPHKVVHASDGHILGITCKDCSRSHVGETFHLNTVFKTPKTRILGRIQRFRTDREDWKQQFRKKEESQKWVLLGKPREETMKRGWEVNNDKWDKFKQDKYWKNTNEFGNQDSSDHLIKCHLMLTYCYW